MQYTIVPLTILPAADGSVGLSGQSRRLSSRARTSLQGLDRRRDCPHENIRPSATRQKSWNEKEVSGNKDNISTDKATARPGWRSLFQSFRDLISVVAKWGNLIVAKVE